MSLGANVAAALTMHVTNGGALNFMQMKSGNHIKYKPVVNGKDLGLYGSMANAMTGAYMNLPGPKNAHWEKKTLDSIMGNSPTMFVDNSTFGDVVDHAAFLPSWGAKALAPVIVNATDDVVGAILGSGMVWWFFDWLLGNIFKDSWHLYLNGRLLATVAAEEVPAIFKSYRRRGMHIQLVKNQPNKGKIGRPIPRNRDQTNKFGRGDWYNPFD